MNYIITEFSKYIMLLAVFSYAVESIWPLFVKDGEKNTGVYIRGLVYVFLIHTLSMVSLYIVTEDIRYITLYILQFIALFALNRLSLMIYEKANRLLVNHACMLLVIGFVELSRLDIDRSARQFFVICASIVIFMFIPGIIKKWGFIKNYTILIGTVGILMLILVYSIGNTVHGSKLSYTLFGFSFQPSEFVKILFVFFVAGMLHENAKLGRMALTSICAAMFVGLLAISKDLGSALIYYIAFIVMVYVASGRVWYSIAGLVAGFGAACAGYRMFSHVQVRIATWLDPWSDIDATGYQLTQSLFAIGSGSWMGMGLGKGQPSTIPLVTEDYMFSAICEEYGTLFGIGIILVYLSLFMLLLKIMLRTKDKFYRIVVAGLSAILCIQTFLTIGGGTRLIPLTGVTLPLISNGGSSAMSCIIIFAVCLGVSILSTGSKSDEDDEDFDEEFNSEYDEEYEPEYLDPAREDDKPVPFAAVAKKRITIPDDFNTEPERMSERDIERALKREILEETLNGTPDTLSREKVHTTHQKSKTKNIKEESTEDKIILHRLKVCAGVLVGCAAVMYLALIVNIVKYMSADRMEAISNDFNIVRQELMAAETVRGSILASDGTILAQTLTDANGNEYRYYPYGDEYAHAVGYCTYGKTGIESTMNIYLINSNISFSARTANGVDGVKNPGDNVTTTLVPEIQDVARSSLGVYKGAIIVTKVDTGEILAMCSTPSFDPNTISENFAEISEDTVNSVLVNRVAQGRYQPGSTFKIVTLLEYMRENPTTYKDYHYTCVGYIKAGDTIIHCFRNHVHGYQDLYASLGNSCNSSFGNIALSLDRLAFADTLNQLYFNTDLPVDFQANQSSASCQVYMDDDELVQTAIGQGKVSMTPLHLNMITQAIANGGEMMTPYLVANVVNAEGGVVKTYSPVSMGQVMTPEEAADLMTYLQYDVENGTARKLGGQPYTAAGKTGSAEYSDSTDASHAWFTGYAPAENPEIVVTIILEGAGTGGDYCVPIARRLFSKYFELTGEYEITEY